MNNIQEFQFKNETLRFRVEALVVYVLLVSMGFPGSYVRVFGGFLQNLFWYSAFLVEIILMLLMSGDSFFDIRLVDVKERFAPIYQFIIIVFAESMLVSADRSGQLVTCVRLSVTILFSIWLVEHFKMSSVIEFFAAAQIIIDLSIIAMVFLRPGIAFQYEHNALRGIYDVKNVMGEEAAFGAAVMFMNMAAKRDNQEHIRFIWVIAFGVQLVFLVMARSVGAIVTVVVLVVYYLMFRRFSSLRLRIGVLYILISVGFLLIVFTILPFFAPIFEALGKDVTLTGRTELWNGIYKFMQRSHMLTGYGYAQFWNTRTEVARLHLMFESTSFFSRMNTGAHNQLMELWLNIGLIGIASYFAMILLSMNKLKYMDSLTYLQISTILLYITMNGLTERNFEGAHTYHIAAFFLVMAAGCFSGPRRAWTRRVLPRRKVSREHSKNNAVLKNR